MQIRKDGEETRHRILVAACQVFGEQGFRDATHAEICALAGANTAAINYHFGSKSALYQAAFEHLARTADALYPMEGDVSPEAPPEERLAAFVGALLHRSLDRESLRYLHEIRMAEMFNPTGHLDEALFRWLMKNRTRLLGILRELAGPEVSEEDLELCEISTVSPCLMMHHRPHHKGTPVPWVTGVDAADRVAEHVVRFSLAGIKAVRKKPEEDSP